MDWLGSIPVFMQVAETRSFTEAGRLLGVSSSAVGKSIARLEERLETRLFHRTTRSISLTAEGIGLLERCRRIAAEAESAEFQLCDSASAPVGKLRISAPQVHGLVMPVLAEFMQRYPQIELDVDLSDRMVDVVEEGFDLVIRTGNPKDSRLLARQVGSFRMVLVGSPGYFREHGLPQSPQELHEHACLRHTFHHTGKLEPWPFKPQLHQPEPLLPTRLTSSSTEALEHAARSGLGIACLPDFMVQASLRCGALQAVLDEYLQFNGTFWVLWPSSRHAAAKLRVLIEHLSERLFPTSCGQ
ncbi:MAG: LysR family transcriptional regulator [Pseudomonas sp.]|uniref:LysR family transcriptional regulator n=1 Tax=unclassified Pseudomonas TaxID=196821 RepID=UPI000731525D|nr:LysR family transcriptional regulator [Pseudomonas sp. L5B5]KTC42011.1 LysR family transcriptional regulator [Pseudomonas sp. ABAC61]UCZ84530.1 LysR family transcriptional regulator [Pseudomonas sp. L5B5]